jgi:hypothetical protein
MGSHDYVGAVHQVLNGTMLDLGVSADFFRGDLTVAGVIVDYAFMVAGVIVGNAFGVDGMISRAGFAAVGVTVGGALLLHAGQVLGRLLDGLGRLLAHLRDLHILLRQLLPHRLGAQLLAQALERLFVRFRDLLPGPPAGAGHTYRPGPARACARRAGRPPRWCASRAVGPQGAEAGAAGAAWDSAWEAGRPPAPQGPMWR